MAKRPVEGTITIAEPVMAVYRKAAAKDNMELGAFLSQMIALAAGMLSEECFTILEPERKEVQPDVHTADRG
jgi:hypothetical protein